MEVVILTATGNAGDAENENVSPALMWSEVLTLLELLNDLPLLTGGKSS